LRITSLASGINSPIVVGGRVSQIADFGRKHDRRF